MSRRPKRLLSMLLAMTFAFSLISGALPSAIAAGDTLPATNLAVGRPVELSVIGGDVIKESVFATSQSQTSRVTSGSPSAGAIADVWGASLQLSNTNYSAEANYVLTMELAEAAFITEVSIEVPQNAGWGIWRPKSVSFEISMNGGGSWTSLGAVSAEDSVLVVRGTNKYIFAKGLSQAGVTHVRATLGRCEVWDGVSEGVNFGVDEFSVMGIEDGLYIANGDIKLEPGDTAAMAAKYFPANDDATVTWSSSDPAVAAVDEVGKLTALKVGSTTITATDNSQGTATCTVRVVDEGRRNLALGSASSSENETIILDLLQSYSISKFILTTDESGADITFEYYNGSNWVEVETVASAQAETISGDSTTYAYVVSGLEIEAQEVRATTTGELTDIVDFAVLGYPDTGATIPVSVSIDKQSVILTSAVNSAQLTATVSPATAYQAVIWGIGDESVATIDENGKLTAVAAGKTYAEARTVLSQYGGAAAVCAVTVDDSLNVSTAVNLAAGLDGDAFTLDMLGAGTNPVATADPPTVYGRGLNGLVQGRLTDGLYGNGNAVGGAWTAYNTTELSLMSERAKYIELERELHHDITLDLGKMSHIESLSFRTMHAPGWGVGAPTEVHYYLSANGEDWSYVGTVDIYEALTGMTVNHDGGLVPTSHYWYDLNGLNYNAQYIRISFEHCDTWVFADELTVMGTASAAGDAIELPNTPGPEFVIKDAYPVPGDTLTGGVSQEILMYTGWSAGNTVLRSVEDFLTNIAYVDVKNSSATNLTDKYEIKDWLYDGVTIIPPNSNKNNTHNFMQVTNKANASTKQDFQDYIDFIFNTADSNMDALNTAAGMAKEALNDPSYRYPVKMSVMPMQYIQDAWGDIGDGATLDFTTDGTKVGNAAAAAARMTAYQWYIDSVIAAFEAKNYQNIELIGFYYFSESLVESTDPAAIDTVKLLNAYIHELKRSHSAGKTMISYWIPYYQSVKIMHWEEFGFDYVCMQPNYFQGRNYPDTRLEEAAELAEMFGMGIEIEFESYAGTGVQNFLKYLVRGNADLLGYQESVSAWYMVTHNIKEWANNVSGRRWLYDAVYKYIKGEKVEFATAITPDDSQVTITAGDTYDLLDNATLIPANPLTGDMTFNSSNPLVATVNNQGVVTAVGDGETVITINASVFGASATVTVTVEGTPKAGYSNLAIGRPVTLGNVGGVYNSYGGTYTEAYNTAKMTERKEQALNGQITTGSPSSANPVFDPAVDSNYVKLNKWFYKNGGAGDPALGCSQYTFEMTLESYAAVDTLVMEFYYNYDSSILSPTAIQFEGSLDGEIWFSMGTATYADHMTEITRGSQIKHVFTLNADEITIKYVRASIVSLGNLSDGSEASWCFVDEFEVWGVKPTVNLAMGGGREFVLDCTINSGSHEGTNLAALNNGVRASSVARPSILSLHKSYSQDDVIRMDLGAVCRINELSLGALQSTGAGIRRPDSIAYEYSLDGDLWTPIDTVTAAQSELSASSNASIELYDYIVTELDITARYIRAKITPPNESNWHWYDEFSIIGWEPLEVSTTPGSLIAGSAAYLDLNVKNINLVANEVKAIFTQNGIVLKEVILENADTRVSLDKLTQPGLIKVSIVVDGYMDFTVPAAKVVAAAYDPFAPIITLDGDKATITFSGKIEADSAEGLTVTRNGTPLTYTIGADGCSLIVEDVQSGDELKIGRIRLPDYYSSYSFTFTVTIP